MRKSKGRDITRLSSLMLAMLLSLMGLTSSVLVSLSNKESRKITFYPEDKGPLEYRFKIKPDTAGVSITQPMTPFLDLPINGKRCTASGYIAYQPNWIWKYCNEKLILEKINKRLKMGVESTVETKLNNVLIKDLQGFNNKKEYLVLGEKDQKMYIWKFNDPSNQDSVEQIEILESSIFKDIKLGTQCGKQGCFGYIYDRFSTTNHQILTIGVSPLKVLNPIDTTKLGSIEYADDNKEIFSSIHFICQLDDELFMVLKYPIGEFKALYLNPKDQSGDLETSTSIYISKNPALASNKAANFYASVGSDNRFWAILVFTTENRFDYFGIVINFGNHKLVQFYNVKITNTCGFNPSTHELSSVEPLMNNGMFFFKEKATKKSAGFGITLNALNEGEMYCWDTSIDSAFFHPTANELYVYTEGKSVFLERSDVSIFIDGAKLDPAETFKEIELFMYSTSNKTERLVSQIAIEYSGAATRISSLISDDSYKQAKHGNYYLDSPFRFAGGSINDFNTNGGTLKFEAEGLKYVDMNRKIDQVLIGNDEINVENLQMVSENVFAVVASNQATIFKCTEAKCESFNKIDITEFKAKSVKIKLMQPYLTVFGKTISDEVLINIYKDYNIKDQIKKELSVPSSRKALTNIIYRLAYSSAIFYYYSSDSAAVESILIRKESQSGSLKQKTESIKIQSTIGELCPTSMMIDSYRTAYIASKCESSRFSRIEGFDLSENPSFGTTIHVENIDEFDSFCVGKKGFLVANLQKNTVWYIFNAETILKKFAIAGESAYPLDYIKVAKIHSLKCLPEGLGAQIFYKDSSNVNRMANLLFSIEGNSKDGMIHSLFKLEIPDTSKHSSIMHRDNLFTVAGSSLKDLKIIRQNMPKTEIIGSFSSIPNRSKIALKYFNWEGVGVNSGYEPSFTFFKEKQLVAPAYNSPEDGILLKKKSNIDEIIGLSGPYKGIKLEVKDASKAKVKLTDRLSLNTGASDLKNIEIIGASKNYVIACQENGPLYLYTDVFDSKIRKQIKLTESTTKAFIRFNSKSKHFFVLSLSTDIEGEKIELFWFKEGDIITDIKSLRSYTINTHRFTEDVFVLESGDGIKFLLADPLEGMLYTTQISEDLKFMKSVTIDPLPITHRFIEGIMADWQGDVSILFEGLLAFNFSNNKMSFKGRYGDGDGALIEDVLQDTIDNIFFLTGHTIVQRSTGEGKFLEYDSPSGFEILDVATSSSNQFFAMFGKSISTEINAQKKFKIFVFRKGIKHYHSSIEVIVPSEIYDDYYEGLIAITGDNKLLISSILKVVEYNGQQFQEADNVGLTAFSISDHITLEISDKIENNSDIVLSILGVSSAKSISIKGIDYTAESEQKLPPKADPESKYMKIVIIASVASILVLLAIFVALYFLCLKNHQEEDPNDLSDYRSIGNEEVLN